MNKMFKMFNYITHSPEFKEVMKLWNKEGFRWDEEDGMIFLTFFAPEIDDSCDYTIVIDLFDYGYTCYRMRDNWSRMISQTEHKLIVETIDVLKKLKKESREKSTYEILE